MFEELKKEYTEMRIEILGSARAPRIVFSRVKNSDKSEECLLWLRRIKESSEYVVAKQRFKEVDDERYARYRASGMMDFPEIAYRKRAFKDLRALWIHSMPAILRRTNGKKA
jgi:hypothetical protein